MCIPKHQDVRLPLLKFLEDGVVHTLAEAIVGMADCFQLTKTNGRNYFLKLTEPKYMTECIGQNTFKYGRFN